MPSRSPSGPVGPVGPVGLSDGTDTQDAATRDAPGAAAPADVRIVDTPAVRVHHPGDLLDLVLATLGIGVVLVVALYAQATATGLTEDVQGFGTVVRRLLQVPQVLVGMIAWLVPLVALGELVLRRLVRQAFEAVGAGLVGILAAVGAGWLLARYGTADLTGPFSVGSVLDLHLSILPTLSGTTALLTAAGARSRRRTASGSWNAIWLALGIALITGLSTLPAVLMTVLIGRVVGLVVRYSSGVQTERAYGSALVDGIRRAGFTPVQLVRVRDVATAHPDGDEALAGDLAAVAITRYGDNRVYAMTTADGDRLDVVVLDGDRQVVGMLTRFWRSLRLRGIDGRAVVSLRQAAERAALLSYAAWSAGVSTPRLLAMAEAEDSMLLVQQHAHGAVPLREVPVELVTDDLLDAVWEQLCIAHGAGLAHRALTSDVVLVERFPARPVPGVDSAGGAEGVSGGARPDDLPTVSVPTVLLTGWESGDVASSELARRMDVSQMLAVLALRVGAERAVASAVRSLPDEDLVAVGPLLQSIALPRATREEARQHKGLLAEVRDALLERLPQADVEPERLVRFGVRTVLSIALTLAVVIIVITTIQFDKVTEALASASDEPWWIATAFLLGLVTFLGSALALVAFAPIKLPLWRVTMVQAASSFVALVAPAGIGPAALNLRMLTRRGVNNALAVASVGLVQVSQLVTTVALLVVLSLVSGTQEPLHLPPATVLVAGAVVVIGLAAALLVPRARQWALARTVPVWRQTWPRLVQMMGQPRRLAVAVAGNLLMTLGYLGAFAACLAAFGRELSLIDLAVIYLVGNATGAVVPSPGGLGAVELALITGLSGPGHIPLPIATSVVVLFRALTFWGRIPLGWLAMRALQRTGEL